MRLNVRCHLSIETLVCGSDLMSAVTVCSCCTNPKNINQRSPRCRPCDKDKREYGGGKYKRPRCPVIVQSKKDGPRVHCPWPIWATPPKKSTGLVSMHVFCWDHANIWVKVLGEHYKRRQTYPLRLYFGDTKKLLRPIVPITSTGGWGPGTSVEPPYQGECSFKEWESVQEAFVLHWFQNTPDTTQTGGPAASGLSASSPGYHPAIESPTPAIQGAFTAQTDRRESPPPKNSGAEYRGFAIQSSKHQSATTVLPPIDIGFGTDPTRGSPKNGSPKEWPQYSGRQHSQGHGGYRPQ